MAPISWFMVSSVSCIFSKHRQRLSDKRFVCKKALRWAIPGLPLNLVHFSQRSIWGRCQMCRQICRQGWRQGCAGGALAHSPVQKCFVLTQASNLSCPHNKTVYLQYVNEVWYKTSQELPVSLFNITMIVMVYFRFCILKEHSMHTVNMMPPQYIGFAEDMMLILFLVCILATLVTVHRATCYRQFQVLIRLISTKR